MRTLHLWLAMLVQTLYHPCTSDGPRGSAVAARGEETTHEHRHHRSRRQRPHRGLRAARTSTTSASSNATPAGRPRQDRRPSRPMTAWSAWTPASSSTTSPPTRADQRLLRRAGSRDPADGDVTGAHLCGPAAWSSARSAPAACSPSQARWHGRRTGAWSPTSAASTASRARRLDDDTWTPRDAGGLPRRRAATATPSATTS